MNHLGVTLRRRITGLFARASRMQVPIFAPSLAEDMRALDCRRHRVVLVVEVLDVHERDVGSSLEAADADIVGADHICQFNQ